MIWLQTCRGPSFYVGCIWGMLIWNNSLSPTHHSALPYKTLEGNVEVLNSVTFMNQTPIFEVVCDQVWIQERTPKKFVLKRDQTIYIEDINHCKLDNHLKWMDLYEHSISMRLFTLIMYKILIRAPKIMRKVGYNLNYLGFVNHLAPIMCFHILGDVG